MTKRLDTDLLDAVMNGARLLSRVNLKSLIHEVRESRRLLQEPDWTGSETGELELWKNPLIPMRDRLVMADGGYSFIRKSHQNVSRQLREVKDQPPAGAAQWMTTDCHTPVAGVRYWLATVSHGVVVGSLGNRNKCQHCYWVT